MNRFTVSDHLRNTILLKYHKKVFNLTSLLLSSFLRQRQSKLENKPKKRSRHEKSKKRTKNKPLKRKEGKKANGQCPLPFNLFETFFSFFALLFLKHRIKKMKPKSKHCQTPYIQKRL